MKNLAKFVLPILIIMALFVVFGSAAQTSAQLSGSMLIPAAAEWQALRVADDPQPAVPTQQDPEGDKLVLGGSYVLNDGDILKGGLVVMGGVASLEKGSSVQGDVVLMGGTLTVDGLVEGDVNALGGLVTLGSSAHVQGDINTFSAQLKREEGARVDGELNTITTGLFSVITPGSLHLPDWEGTPPITLPFDVQSPDVGIRLNPLWDGLWWLIRSFIWAIMAVLIALFTPKAIGRAAHAAVSNPAASGGLGCLTILVAPLILILLAITICGLPISLIGLLVFWLAWVFGVIVLGAETGKRLALMLKWDWALPVSAGVGTFGLTLVMNGIELIVPCIGWLAPLFVGLIGLGAVLLTRFGTRRYPTADLAPAAVPGSALIVDETDPSTDQGEISEVDPNAQ